MVLVGVWHNVYETYYAPTASTLILVRLHLIADHTEYSCHESLSQEIPVERYSGSCTVLALIPPDAHENFKWCCVPLHHHTAPTRAVPVHYACKLDEAQIHRVVS